MNDVTLVAYDSDGNEILEWRNQPADGPEADKAKDQTERPTK